VAGKAQIWDEWFRQKATQKKYLLQQIAAFEAYLKDIKKGYAAVITGIQAINDITHGEFNLHNDFFSSLGMVNLQIKNMAAVADIITKQAVIVRKFKSLANAAVSSDEAAYIGRIYQNVTNACITDINMLIDILTDHVLQLNDEQRIKRIIELHQSIQDKYMFAQSFTGQVSILLQQRIKEWSDINTVRVLYNLKQGGRKNYWQ
jgi:hypothetical protein